MTSPTISEDPDGKEEQQLRYLDPEKYDYIQNYLVESEAHSVTPESDSGRPGSIGAPSEVGTEETAGNKKYFLYYLYSHCELSEKH